MNDISLFTDNTDYLKHICAVCTVDYLMFPVYCEPRALVSGCH